MGDPDDHVTSPVAPSVLGRWDPGRPPHGLARFATNGETTIHYLDTGPADEGAAPVVFVPGITCVAEDYTDVLAAFGRRVLVIDLRGRGRSSTPESGYTRDDHVRDIEAVLDHAGIGRFHLATFSRGTTYGLPHALAHPSQVVSIVVGDYICGEVGITDEGWALEFLRGRWRGTPVASRIREAALVGIVRESVERRYEDEVARLGIPTVVVRSGAPGPDGQPFVNDVEQERWRRAGADIVTFEASGHDIFRPDPLAFPLLVRAHTTSHP